MTKSSGGWDSSSEEGIKESSGERGNRVMREDKWLRAMLR